MIGKDTEGVPQDLYSLDEVAARLGLHVRTVRGYVRDGRLRATRIGKQYRVAREDLAAFTGRRAPPDGPARAEASAVVHVEPVSTERADRLSSAILAAAGTDARLRVECLRDPDRARLTVVILGAAGPAAEVLRLLAALTEDAT